MNKEPEALRLAKWWEQQSHNHALTPESKTAAELRRLHQHELSSRDWLDKTNWVQETAQAGEFGMHRADVLKKRIEKLEAINQDLVAALKVTALAIHEYRTQGSPHAYWDDVQEQARAAIAKAEGDTQ